MSDDSTTRIKTTRSLASNNSANAWKPLRVRLPDNIPATSSIVPPPKPLAQTSEQTRPDHKRIPSAAPLRPNPPPLRAPAPVMRPSDAGEIITSDIDFVTQPGTLSPPKPIMPPPVPLDMLAVLLDDDQTTVSSAWYKDFFDADYIRSIPLPHPQTVRTECDFIEKSLVLSRGASILDVGCGMGMHAIELATRGYQVTALDISPAMLQRAQRESKHQQVNVRWMQGDMRELMQERAFDAVLSWGTSFGYFEDADNERVLDLMARALKPEGVLLMQVINRDYFIRSQPNQVWFELADQLCMEESSFDYDHSRLHVRRRIVSPEGVENRRECSIRLYALHELVSLLRDAQFDIEEVSGRMALRGIFFGGDSAEIIVRARKGLNTGRTSLRSRPPTPPPVPGGDATPTQKVRSSIPPRKT